jgi:TonB-dependent SusC/RagA subfamily outer membrane receptor
VKTAQMQEVVVTTGLGIARQSKEIGYSTAKVKAAELTQAKVVNLQNGLTGKVSGLNVATTNNGVFADTRITLRGIRSLTGNNQPMLVLDGVPLSLGFLNSINPNDILDVTILKSASSTAIYGPDGVNGAIVVVTKRGNKSKPQVTLSHTTQLEKISYLPKFQHVLAVVILLMHLDMAHLNQSSSKAGVMNLMVLYVNSDKQVLMEKN